VAAGIALALSALVVLAALAALVRRGARSRAVRVGWALALLGLAGVWVAGHVEVAVAGMQLARPWAGAPVSWVLAGLLLAAAAGADGAGAWMGVVDSAKRAEAALMAAVMLAGPTFILADTLWQWRSGREVAVSRSRAPALPQVAALSGLSEARTSTLVVGRDGEATTWQVVRGTGVRLDQAAAVIGTGRLAGSLGEAGVEPLSPGATIISGLVADAASGTAQHLAGSLAQAGIGFLLAPPGHKALAAALDATEGLARAAETDSGILWRVGSADSAERPSWARLKLSSGASEMLPAQDAWIDPGDPNRLVILAESADPGWTASLGGCPLEPVEIGWQQAFVVGDCGGRLVIAYPPDRLAVPQLIALALAGMVALPLRRRREAEAS
jgi:hypothetical protein